MSLLVPIFRILWISLVEIAGDFEAEAVHRSICAGGQQFHFADAEVAQDLRADAIVGRSYLRRHGAGLMRWTGVGVSGDAQHDDAERFGMRSIAPMIGHE